MLSTQDNCVWMTGGEGGAQTTDYTTESLQEVKSQRTHVAMSLRAWAREAPAVWRQAAVRDPPPRFLPHILHPCPAVLQI
jgi:hypothetical protein